MVMVRCMTEVRRMARQRQVIVVAHVCCNA
jgi:hypothetical protein